ncbi:MAG: rRNA maturation RNase YbeY [Bacteroidota bacterium]
MDISFHSEEIRFELKQKIFHKKWIRLWLESHQVHPGALSFIFTSNEHLRLMNQEFLNHNYFTDVITFDYTEGKEISGDVFISIEQVWLNAERYGVSVEEEQRRVMIHGVLHLMGYGDASGDEKKIMRKKENEALHLWLNLSQNGFRI